jgi:hypothetical protein
MTKVILALAVVALAAGAGPAIAAPNECTAQALNPVLIPGPRGINAVHGTVVVRCIGQVTTVIVDANLVRGGRVMASRNYSGPAPLGFRRRVAAVAPCRRSIIPRRWRVLGSVLARNPYGNAYTAVQGTAVWLRCK